MAEAELQAPILRPLSPPMRTTPPAKLLKTNGPVIPTCSTRSTIVACSGTPYFFLYGGFDERENLDSNVYLLNAETMQWEVDDKVDTLYREGHLAAYIGNGNVLVFGGIPFEDDIPSAHRVGRNNSSRLSGSTSRNGNGNGNDNGNESESVNLNENGNVIISETSFNAAGSTALQDFRNDSLMMIYNVFDRKWTGAPEFALQNAPAQRSRHACCLSPDGTKMYISGGQYKSQTFNDLYCYDLSTGVWTGPIEFVTRFSHTIMCSGDRIFSFGGLGKEMNRVNAIIYLSLKDQSIGEMSVSNFPTYNPDGFLHTLEILEYRAQTSLAILVLLPTEIARHRRVTLRSFNLCDFETNVFLNNESDRIFLQDPEQRDKEYVWYHLLVDNQGYLNLLGNELHEYPMDEESMTGLTDRIDPQTWKLNLLLRINLSAFGLKKGKEKYGLNDREADKLSSDFKLILATSEFSDFQIETVVTEQDRSNFELQQPYQTKSIPVHKAILAARWPHFNRMISSGMAETVTNKVLIPEPYHRVMAIISYLYVGYVDEDGIRNNGHSLELHDYASLVGLANLYELQDLKVMIIQKVFVLLKQLALQLHQGSTGSIATLLLVWKDISLANEPLLLSKIMYLVRQYWAAITRSQAFTNELSREQIVKLCQDFSDYHPDGFKRQDEVQASSIFSTLLEVESLSRNSRNSRTSRASRNSRNSTDSLGLTPSPGTPAPRTHSPFVFNSPAFDSSHISSNL